jgi:hypothetical protein
MFNIWRWWRRDASMSWDQARQLFREHRPQLEEAFLKAASASGKPRGLRWKECQWSDLIAWAREKQTGMMLALVGVTIAFEAIEGSDMEGVAAVGNLRNASAVFFLRDGRWQTNGRVIFNLNPDEAIEHLKGEVERAT